MSGDRLFFDRIDNRYVVTATLRARTAFRVGAGRDDGAVNSDLPVLHTRDGRRVVPGSSWKGVFRSAAERYLRSMAPPGQTLKWACDPFGRRPDPENDAGCCVESGAEGADGPASPKVETARDKVRRACRACKTFGAPGLASHVRFSDSSFSAGPRVRDGVGIDRDLRRAADRIKFDYEVIEPGSELTLTVHLENAEDWQVGLILLVLEDLRDGFVRVGGFGSRGLGWFELAEGSPTVRRLGFDDIVLRREGEVLAGDAALSVFFDALDRLRKEAA